MSSSLYTMRDVMRVVFRYKCVIMTALFFSVAFSYLHIQMKTPLYESTALILVTGRMAAQAPYYQDMLQEFNRDALLTQIALIRSDSVLIRASRLLQYHKRPETYEELFCTDLKKKWIAVKKRVYQSLRRKKKTKTLSKEDLIRSAADRLRKSLSVEPVFRTHLIRVSARDYDPDEAARIANVVSRSAVIFDLQQKLAEYHLKFGKKHPVLVQLEQNMEKMMSGIPGELVPVIEALGPASIKITQQAHPPLEPVRVFQAPKIILLFVSAILGLLFGLVMAVVLDIVDTTYKIPLDLEKDLRLPVLGSIPRTGIFRKKIGIDRRGQSSSYSRAFLQLSDQLLLLKKRTGKKNILFTGTSVGEGVSTIVSNLGLQLSENAHQKVLVMDMNVHHLSLGRMLKASQEHGGLDGYLNGEASFDEAVHPVNENLFLTLFRSRVTSPLVSFSSSRFESFMKTAAERYDWIFLDSAGIGDQKEAHVLAESVDGIIFVVRAGKTRKQVLEANLKSVRKGSVDILGVILNARKYDIPAVIYNRL